MPAIPAAIRLAARLTLAAVLAAAAGCGRKPEPPKITISPDQWAPRQVEALTLSSPYAFSSGPDLSGHLPPEVRERIADWKTYVCAEVASPLRVEISHLTFREGVPVDLDASVDGAMRQAAGALGQADPDYTTAVLEIGGSPARRIAWHADAKGHPIVMDALFVLRGQQLWHIQTIATSPSAQPEADRLLRSAVLPPEAP